MKHTPAPWDIRTQKDARATYHLVNTRIETKEEADANACLIAAAPELLEACKTALECLENNGFGKDYVQDCLRIAINKTEGGN